MKNIIFIGAVGLCIVAVIPIFFSGIFGANVSFGGTSLIIIVGVLLETLKQIESMMLVRHYKGFLNDWQVWFFAVSKKPYGDISCLYGAARERIYYNIYESSEVVGHMFGGKLWK